jgi:uncharacterized protein (TIGR00645 family)
MNFLTRVEHALERLLFSSRWLLAPFFLMLILCLLALLVKAAQHVLHMMETLLTATETSVVLDCLSLIDVTFGASLVVLVIFSGYENFVSRIDSANDGSWPDWMRSIDFNGLKLKLMSSIVAISAIQTLRVMLDAQNHTDRELGWSIGIHLAFVASAVLLALMDRLASGHSGEH